MLDHHRENGIGTGIIIANESRLDITGMIGIGIDMIGGRGTIRRRRLEEVETVWVDLIEGLIGEIEVRREVWGIEREWGGVAVRLIEIGTGIGIEGMIEEMRGGMARGEMAREGMVRAGMCIGLARG